MVKPILTTRIPDYEVDERCDADRIIGVLVLTVAFLVLTVTCGSNRSCCDPTFSKINSDPTVRDLTSFDRAGFKMAKEYDVSELPLATSAYMGYFTTPDGVPVQYELRMYPDHASAIEAGVEYADEVTGVDAFLRSVDVRWEEGTRDRRGGGAARGSLTPLYGDYAVIGNIVMLCQGRDSDQALERCASLLWAAGIGVER